MAKRLTDTDKWKDDWYTSLCNDYKIVWQWLLDNCNHAGICKRSINLLCRDASVNISEKDLVIILEDRLLIHNNLWFIPKFLKFQYPNLTSQKPVIVSVVNELIKTGLDVMIPQSFGNDYLIIKDKSKSKDKGSLKPLPGKTDFNSDRAINEYEDQKMWTSAKRDFLNHEQWQYQFCTAKNIDQSFLKKQMNEFISDLELQEDFKDVQELRNHFTKWFNKRSREGFSINGQSEKKMVI